ncbi:hypothetical protein [Motiliproteus sp.]|uniref:hypothetical protein n=1 Tax=Motiliproteus sp. TaxID=1898955 RepID=UPI003BAA02A7
MSHCMDVYLTVDTEASIAGCFSNPERFQPLLSEPVDGLVQGRSQALGFLLQTLQQSGLRATFFTETLQSRYFGHEPMRLRAEQILEANQDLQLHVHPCWRNFTDGKVVKTEPDDHSTGRSVDELEAIFAEAIERFEAWSLGSPVAVRTGNFSAGRDTFQALKRVGIKASSNISVPTCPPADTGLHHLYGYQQIEGVLEVPLSAFNSFSVKGSKVLRPLALTACSSAELISVIEQAHQKGFEMLCLITHPFEFINRDSYRFDNMRPNPVNQQRLTELCDFLASNRDRFNVTTFGELDPLRPPSPTLSDSTLSGSYLAMLHRTAQNYYTDHFR